MNEDRDDFLQRCEQKYNAQPATTKVSDQPAVDQPAVDLDLSQVTEWITQNLNSTHKIHIGGHSLGGYYAAILYCKLSLNSRNTMGRCCIFNPAITSSLTEYIQDTNSRTNGFTINAYRHYRDIVSILALSCDGLNVINIDDLGIVQPSGTNNQTYVEKHFQNIRRAITYNVSQILDFHGMRRFTAGVVARGSVGGRSRTKPSSRKRFIRSRSRKRRHMITRRKTVR